MVWGEGEKGRKEAVFAHLALVSFKQKRQFGGSNNACACWCDGLLHTITTINGSSSPICKLGETFFQRDSLLSVLHIVEFASQQLLAQFLFFFSLACLDFGRLDCHDLVLVGPQEVCVQCKHADRIYQDRHTGPHQAECVAWRVAGNTVVVAHVLGRTGYLPARVDIKTIECAENSRRNTGRAKGKARVDKTRIGVIGAMENEGNDDDGEKKKKKDNNKNNNTSK